MKKLNSTETFLLISLIYLTTIFFGTTLAAQTFKTNSYSGEYDQKLKQPLWVEYTVSCTDGEESRIGMDFWIPEDFNTSTDEDYKNNIWDKGHLAPAASFSCSEEDLHSTFSYLNCALQHQGLNRGQWSRLEAFVRQLASFYEKDIDVRVDVLFEGECKVLPSGATVPSGFKKSITIDGNTKVFVFPNIDTKGTKWIEYIIK